MRFLKLLLMLLLSSNLLAQSISAKKQHFKELVVPAVDKVYTELETQYVEVSHYIYKPHSYYKDEIQRLKKLYNAKSDEDLLQRLKPHPRSIAIAQAAMESAWATSRFFKKANNIFGVWSFNPNEPRIAASEQRGTKTIWLKKYASVEDSIRDYYKIIATGRAFKSFRALRIKTDNPYELVKKLDKYSELGAKYGEELSNVISYNKFYLYDK
jgi:Bax protein